MNTYEQQLRVEAAHRSDRVNARQVKRGWLQSSTVIAYMNRRITGDPKLDWFQWVNQRYLARTQREYALSLGCNDGAFERAVVASAAVRTLEGVDINPEAISVARPAAQLEQVAA